MICQSLKFNNICIKESHSTSLWTFLLQVYATMSPIDHIVNVGPAATEPHANITLPESHHFIKTNLFINTVRLSFADESGNLIYSGSDDNLCKVWDRRCIRAKEKPAGILMGHLEGVTFLDSRGDGRYLISYGKDQTIKLWDIQRMSSSGNCNPGFRNYEWDYRWMDYPPHARDLKHPNDQSVATYKGHSVLRTLIGCYFSPAYSTGQKYVYTGSHDSCVYIYDVVSGAQVAKLKHHKSTVRDCSWHPYYPMLVRTAWDGDVVKWEFPGTGEAPVHSNKGRMQRI